MIYFPQEIRKPVPNKKAMSQNQRSNKKNNALPGIVHSGWFFGHRFVRQNPYVPPWIGGSFNTDGMVDELMKHRSFQFPGHVSKTHIPTIYVLEGYTDSLFWGIAQLYCHSLRSQGRVGTMAASTKFNHGSGSCKMLLTVKHLLETFVFFWG